MYKYGEIPQKKADQKNCMVRGDAGVYEVVSVLEQEAIIVRAGYQETHNVSKLKFISKEQFDRHMQLTNPMKTHPCKLIETISLDTIGVKLDVVSASVGRDALGEIVINDLMYVFVSPDSTNSLPRFSKSLINKTFEPKIDWFERINSADSIDTLVRTLIEADNGVEVGKEYLLEEPLKSLEPQRILISKIDGTTLYYKKMTKSGKPGKKEFCFFPDYRYRIVREH
ncbi:hypothetical protein C4G84_RS23150 [Vibrio parahaemolyticus O5:K30]|uniref:hypothetical protein n=1 Tax=Vibrio vulnificus TaxID=672 RepID=UPI003D9C87CC|nr:hypothetical protein [Vibrio parahaemolyticus O5:K30]